MEKLIASSVPHMAQPLLEDGDDDPRAAALADAASQPVSVQVLRAGLDSDDEGDAGVGGAACRGPLRHTVRLGMPAVGHVTLTFVSGGGVEVEPEARKSRSSRRSRGQRRAQASSDADAKSDALRAARIRAQLGRDVAQASNASLSPPVIDRRRAGSPPNQPSPPAARTPQPPTQPLAAHAPQRAGGRAAAVKRRAVAGLAGSVAAIADGANDAAVVKVRPLPGGDVLAVNAASRHVRLAKLNGTPFPCGYVPVAVPVAPAPRRQPVRDGSRRWLLLSPVGPGKSSPRGDAQALGSFTSAPDTPTRGRRGTTAGAPTAGGTIGFDGDGGSARELLPTVTRRVWMPLAHEPIDALMPTVREVRVPTGAIFEPSVVWLAGADAALQADGHGGDGVDAHPTPSRPAAAGAQALQAAGGGAGDDSDAIVLRVLRRHRAHMARLLAHAEARCHGHRDGAAME
jgi:hypothetical protein